MQIAVSGGAAGGRGAWGRGAGEEGGRRAGDLLGWPIRAGTRDESDSISRAAPSSGGLMAPNVVEFEGRCGGGPHLGLASLGHSSPLRGEESWLVHLEEDAAGGLDLLVEHLAVPGVDGVAGLGVDLQQRVECVAGEGAGELLEDAEFHAGDAADVDE